MQVAYMYSTVQVAYYVSTVQVHTVSTVQYIQYKLHTMCNIYGNIKNTYSIY